MAGAAHASVQGTFLPDAQEMAGWFATSESASAASIPEPRTPADATIADGSTLAVYRGSYRPGDSTAEPKQWTVSLLRTDGVTVTLSEWNARTEKQATPTRPAPPVPVQAAERFVRDDAWQVHVPQSEIDADAGLFDAHPVSN